MASKDSNHNHIVRCFERHGADVIEMHNIGGGVPDLCIGYAGRNILVEIKMPMRERERQAADLGEAFLNKVDRLHRTTLSRIQRTGTSRGVGTRPSSCGTKTTLRLCWMRYIETTLLGEEHITFDQIASMYGEAMRRCEISGDRTGGLRWAINSRAFHQDILTLTDEHNRPLVSSFAASVASIKGAFAKAASPKADILLLGLKVLIVDSVKHLPESRVIRIEHEDFADEDDFTALCREALDDDAGSSTAN